jgi:hypothetical protein
MHSQSVSAESRDCDYHFPAFTVVIMMLVLRAKKPVLPVGASKTLGVACDNLFFIVSEPTVSLFLIWVMLESGLGLTTVLAKPKRPQKSNQSSITPNTSYKLGCHR